MSSIKTSACKCCISVLNHIKPLWDPKKKPGCFFFFPGLSQTQTVAPKRNSGKLRQTRRWWKTITLSPYKCLPSWASYIMSNLTPGTPISPTITLWLQRSPLGAADAQREPSDRWTRASDLVWEDVEMQTKKTWRWRPVYPQHKGLWWQRVILKMKPGSLAT